MWEHQGSCRQKAQPASPSTAACRTMPRTLTSLEGRHCHELLLDKVPLMSCWSRECEGRAWSGRAASSAPPQHGERQRTAPDTPLKPLLL